MDESEIIEHLAEFGLCYEYREDNHIEGPHHIYDPSDPDWSYDTEGYDEVYGFIWGLKKGREITTLDRGPIK